MANQDIETSIYNGLHKVTFQNSGHRYTIDGVKQVGVTTIIGKVITKSSLMLWPLNMAMRYLEPKVPHITREDLVEARKAHEKKRDAGADTGTQVHELVELSLSAPADGPLGIAPVVADPEAAQAWQGFLAWHKKTQPITVAVEQVVYSHTFKYVGTFDSILEIEGKNYLIDLKTTNASQAAPHGIYAEHFIQLGAYYMAYEEQRQYELAHGGTSLVAIDDLMILSCKKNGTVHTRTASQLGLTRENCMTLWQNTLSLHNYLSSIKRKLGGV